MSDKSEDGFINGFLSGDEIVIKAFYKKHFPEVKNYILKNSGSKADAEDVFQDALVLTYKKLKSDSLRLECSLATYIYAVSRNIWMNTLRRRNKVMFWDKVPDIPEPLNMDILDHIENQERINLYQKYFLRLTDTCQRLLRYFFSGKSMSEISNKMKYSEGYTRKKKFECKKRLIELLETDSTFKELKQEPSKEKES